MASQANGDTWLSMQDSYQPDTNPHPFDTTSQGRQPDPQVYGYQHDRRSFPAGTHPFDPNNPASQHSYSPHQPGGGGSGPLMENGHVGGPPINSQGSGGPAMRHGAVGGPVVGHGGVGCAPIGSQVSGGPPIGSQGSGGPPIRSQRWPRRSWRRGAPVIGSHGSGGHTHPNTPPVAPLGRHRAPDTGGLGPMRSPRRASLVPSPTPYARYESRQHLGDKVDYQSNSSGAPPSWISQNHTSSDTSTASLRTETVTWIRDNIGELQACLKKPEELVKIAQPLFNIPKQERWPATVVLQLAAFEALAAKLETQERPAAVAVEAPSNSLVAFVSTTLRRVLLSPDLDSFGRQSSLKNHDAKTPYSLVKEAIDQQSEEWLQTHLSVKWRDNAELVEKVDQAIHNQLKNQKSVLLTIIKNGLANPKGVPKLSKLVPEVYRQMTTRYKDVENHKINADSSITNAAKARLAYLRLMIHLNQLQQAKSKGKKSSAPPPLLDCH
ncbi:hypothetical protein PTTG_29794 [Puccinia triticina 1-1 BBBD Race 1]|uniref:Uncharacterized protein n=2 Tax=Puccinia triticina TaxID=208348 RepID=A0A180G1Z0_PUCT1|nr:uncharacterized protein PtA15_4A681 [Puccinia triticina]OAV86644.1 hypothetical protein PTTG_29794 [Puccinia triticina 1-1 BBBD Race 1]WAQ84229.1 hypothetical protein PtA15_4A681 [Puccinia triticina]WAR55057.1 hypothetical protein PtB15_4B676 [Puccinia triticina]